MTGLALNMNLDLVLARRHKSHIARMIMRVQRIAKIRMQQALVKILRTMYPIFLGHCKHNLNRAMRNLFFLELAQGFKNGCHAGLVIAAQNRRAVRTDNTILYHRLNAAAGLHTIHMGGQHHRGCINRTRKIRYKIPGIAADFFAGMVFLNRAA